MGYLALERKVELAIEVLLDALDLDGVPVYIGGNSADETEEGEQGIRPPYIIVSCDSGTPDMDGELDGVMRMTARVEVWTHKHDEPGDAHGDRVSAVRDALMVDDLATQLTDAADDFTCHDVRAWNLSESNEDIHFINTLTLELVCSAADT